MENRFDSKGICKCDYIKNGTCKQISACDCCEYYCHKYTEESFGIGSVPKGFYFSNGFYGAGGHFIRNR